MGYRLDTRVIHAGEPRPGKDGAVVLPIYQSANYETGNETDYHELKYIRLNNTPNHKALHEKLASLEGGGAALVTASGMAAISTALLGTVGHGEHLLAQDCLYGGTHTFLNHDWAGFGRTVDFVDLSRPDSWKARLTSKTRAIYVETISNPLMQVFDLDAVVRFAKEHKLVAMIDNTFATPIHYRPIEHGFDLVMHSCTKYLNGHSDIVAGAIVGDPPRIKKLTHFMNHLGGSLDPHACFLLHRGLKTLAVRVRHQAATALEVAKALAKHPEVVKVHYPGLESSPYHALAKRQFGGAYGAMLSFELKEPDRADAWMNACHLPVCAASLGGVESLVTRPATTSHSGMTREERQAAGISEGLIRVSIGLEDPQDLIEDFQAAFKVDRSAVSV